MWRQQRATMSGRWQPIEALLQAAPSASTLVATSHAHARCMYSVRHSTSCFRARLVPSRAPGTNNNIYSRCLTSWTRNTTVPSTGLIHQRQEQQNPPRNPAIDPASSLPFLDYRTNDSRNVYYTKDREEANRWLADNQSKLFAFDAEWKPSYLCNGKQGRISLVQLGDGRDIFLFHVHHMDHFPEELQKILESERTLKVGINIRNDGRKLWKDWGIASASLVELGALCIQVMGDLENRRKVRSMTTLAEELLGHAVAKDSFVRKGDWEWKNLSARQLSYAANDAFVTFEVAQRIKDLQQRPQPPGELEYTVPLQTITKSGGGKLTTVRGTLDRIEMEGFTDEDIVVQPPPSSSKVAGDKKESADVKEKERRQTTKTTIVVEGRKASKAALSTTVKGRKDEDITKAKSGMLPIAQPLLPPSHTFKPPLLPEPIVLKYAGGQWTRKVIPASDFAQNSTMQANNTPTNTPSLHIPGGHSGLHKDSEPGVTSAKIVKSYQKTVVIIPRAALMQKASNMASSSTMARINGRHAPAGSNTAIPYNTDRSGTQRESDEEEEEDTIGSVPRLPQHLLPTSMEHLDVLQRNQKVWRETAGKDIAEDLDEAFLPDDDWHLRQNEAVFQSLFTSLPEEDDG